MKHKARRERFRALIASPQCLRPAPVNDPVTARIAETLGFELAMMAGSMASLAVLAAPDLVLITLSELAEQARRIGRASDIPLLVDADHGFGNALNVARTVEEMETAGVAAVTIEDTNLPAPFGSKAAELITVDEGLGKMRAAVSARSDPSMLIVARTSAAGLADKADAVRRAALYAGSGVDALFLSMVKTRDILDAISDAVRIPIFLGAAEPEVQDLGYLESRGVRIWLFGHQPIIAAVRAAHDSMKALRGGEDTGAMAPVASNELMRQLLRQETWVAIRDTFAAPNGHL